MKKFAKLFLSLVVIMTMLVFCLSGCTKPETDTSEKTITVYIGTTEYEVKTTKTILYDVLDEMKTAGQITTLTYSSGAMPMLMQINDQKASEDFANDPTFIAVFHDMNDALLVSYSWETNKPTADAFDGKLFFFSGVGLKDLPIRDGQQYRLFATAKNYF